jgi:outer membrane protein
MVKAQHDRDLAVLQIRAAEGTLTAENLKLPVEPYDPKRHYEDVRDQWAGFSKDDARYAVKYLSLSYPVIVLHSMCGM